MAFGNSFGGGVSGGGVPAADSVTSAMLAPALRQSLFSRNLLKNPNFAIIQGAASGSLANSTALPTASLGYPGETEWIAAAAGGTPAYAFSAANGNVTFTGAASTTNIYFAQRIESIDVVRLANKLSTLTFSAEISNSLLTSVTWEVFRPTTSDDLHGTIGAPTQTLIASGTFTVTSTLTRYSASFTLPALASRGLEVRLRVDAQTSGTWVVARLQLEEGGAPTAFNCEGFSVEVLRCKRYYIRMSDYLYAYFASAGILNTEASHPNMFGTSRIRVLLAANSLGATISLNAGTDESTTITGYANAAGAGYYGGAPRYSVSAHIP